jgi:hypothetical protein
MKMIRQYDNRVSREGMALPCLTKRSAQFIDVLCQQSEMPFRQIDGEEETASCDEVATIVGHGGLLKR